MKSNEFYLNFSLNYEFKQDWPLITIDDGEHCNVRCNVRHVGRFQLQKKKKSSLSKRSKSESRNGYVSGHKWQNMAKYFYELYILSLVFVIITYRQQLSRGSCPFHLSGLCIVESGIHMWCMYKHYIAVASCVPSCTKMIQKLHSAVVFAPNFILWFLWIWNQNAYKIFFIHKSNHMNIFFLLFVLLIYRLVLLLLKMFDIGKCTNLCLHK